MVNKLDKLKDVASDPTSPAAPALRLKRNMQRTMGLARMIRAIAEERLPRFLHNPGAQQLAGDLANVDVRDLAIVAVHIKGSRGHLLVSG
jgi:hypothetical protein